MKMRGWSMSWVLVTGLAACGGDDITGGSVADAAGPDAPAPLDVAEREWVWHPVDGNRCMDGSATGIGLNLDTSSTKLMFILQGGGACFNSLSCTDVGNQDGFGAAELDAWVAGQSGLASRTDPDNPLADWSYVFIPYCTGDIHIGANPDGINGREMVGYGNVGRAAQLIAQRFPGAIDQVLVAGQSAGGFGAYYDFAQIAEIFAGTQVDMLDDSGQVMSDTYLRPCLQTLLRDVWNLDETLPDDCPSCTGNDGGGLSNLVGYLSDKYPDSNFGVISSYRDATIRRFYGFGYPSCETPMVPMDSAAFELGVIEMRDDILGATANARAYTIEGDGHVFTNDALGATTVDGVSLGQWIGQLVDHQPSWDHVIPPGT